MLVSKDGPKTSSRGLHPIPLNWGSVTTWAIEYVRSHIQQFSRSRKQTNKKVSSNFFLSRLALGTHPPYSEEAQSAHGKSHKEMDQGIRPQPHKIPNWKSVPTFQSWDELSWQWIFKAQQMPCGAKMSCYHQILQNSRFVIIMHYWCYLSY